MGPVVIFDKSALQALSVDESVWFEAFCSANVIPIFYVETLADLEKQVKAGRTPEEVVGGLAEKTPTNAYPNVYHRKLALADLMGQTITMDGRPVVEQGDYRRAPDGKVGLHVEEFAEAQALARWRDHEFLEIERTVAKGWRDELAALDLGEAAQRVRRVLPRDRKISSLEQLKQYVDAFAAGLSRAPLDLALDLLGVTNSTRKAVHRRWSSAGKPSLPRLAPYATHVFKVDLVFLLGITRGFISGDRPSNKADIAYLYYLPFCHAFVSGDNLHRRTVPLFLSERQTFLGTEDLKSALREFDSFYEQLPAETKALGVMRFAQYPPADIENAITRIWDSTAGPDWRERSKQQAAAVLQPPSTPVRDDPTAAEITELTDAATPIEDEAEVDPDYIVIQRRVPATKGKWRIISEDVANADS